MRENGDVMVASTADTATDVGKNLDEQSNLIVRDLSSYLDYQQTHAKMLHFTQSRNEDSRDEVWFLQHSPVFTQGQAGKAEHVLFAGDIPVVQSDRGGQVTYHGPGQLVVYLMIDIKRKNWGPRQLVSAIEDAIVATLHDFGIDSAPKQDAPGVYVTREDANESKLSGGVYNAKIASLGLRIKQGRSFHGLALNIDMDMEPFHRINPCGYAGLEMTQVISELPADKPLAKDAKQKLFDNVSTQLKHHLTQCLQYTDYIELPA